MPYDELKDYLSHDLYGGNLDHDYNQDYHSDYFSWPMSLGLYISVFLLLPGLVYTALHALDFNLLPFPELLWNCFVYTTPSRFLDILDNDRKMSTVSESALTSIPRTHAAKSEAMRRLLGFDRAGGIMGTVAKASRRRLSSLSGINMVLQGNDGRPPGLGNWDNSCYQNSVLQGLASLDSLSGYLTDPVLSQPAAKIVGNPNMKMADSLRTLIAHLKDPSNNGKRIWTPATLKSMSSWQQQDAQEYFSKVLDEVDKEIIKVVEAKESLPGLSEQELDGINDNLSRICRLKTATKTKIRSPLEGLLAQRVGCTRCGYSEGLSLIPFNCLTVQLGKRYSYDLLECLDEYTKLEPIEGVECGKCTLLKSQRLLSLLLERTKDSPPDNQGRISTTTRLNAVTEALEDDDYEDKTLAQKCNIPPKNRINTIKSRQAVIARSPKSLVVHVNRSLFDEITGELKKNYAEVRFSKRIDLGPWCLGSTGMANNIHYEEWLLDPAQSMVAGSATPSRTHGPIYELRAVVTHFGRHENGHYVCYRKHPIVHMTDKSIQNEQWWRLSDDDVIKVSEENVLGQGGVFMLFYDLIEPAAPSPCETESTTSLDISVEVEIAASISLPAENDDELDDSDFDGCSPSTTSRKQSAVTSISDETSNEDYQYTEGIRIPAHIQTNGTYYTNETKEHSIRSPGSKVVV